MAADGPVVLEANLGSAFNLMQLAHGKGILNDDFLEFLYQQGFKLPRKLDRLRSHHKGR